MLARNINRRTGLYKNYDFQIQKIAQLQIVFSRAWISINNIQDKYFIEDKIRILIFNNLNDTRII